MNKKSILVLILSFLLNPLLTILGMAFFMLSFGDKRVGEKNRHLLYIVGMFCCVFLSVVNMVKVPEVDMAVYIEWYKMAGNYSIEKYLLEAPGTNSYKEPLYHAVVWALYRIYMGNVPLFLFTLSFLEYFPCVISLVYFGDKLRMRVYVILCGILLLCFIPYIYLHSMNIVRQTIANGILCYIMVQHFFYNKRCWGWMLAMTLVHSTSALFLPVLLIPAFGKPFLRAKVWYAGSFVLLVGIQVVAERLLQIGDFEEESTAAYALNRATHGAVGNYELTISIAVLIAIMLVYSFFVHAGKMLPATSGLRKFSFVNIFVSLFILLNIQEGLWASRFSHYWFTFLPFMLIIGFQSFKIDKLILLVLSLGMIVFWSVYLYIGRWTYDIPAGPWLTPVPVYF